MSLRRFSVAPLCLLAACVGSVADPDTPMGVERPAAPSLGPPARPADHPARQPADARPPLPSPSGQVRPPDRCGETPEAATPRRLWRLTRSQYLNTLTVLFHGRRSAKRKDPSLPAGLVSPLASVDTVHRFDTYAGTHALSDFELRQALTLGAETSRRLVEHLRKEARGCLAPTSKTPFATCAAELVRDKGAILFRRPLTEGEAAQYMGIVHAQLPTLGEDEALGLALQAMLLAPQFLFLQEIGTPVAGKPRLARLAPYEVASALSYAITGWPPDEELWSAATRGELGTLGQIRAHADRLVAALPTTRARDFLWQYFELENVRNVPKTNEGHGNYSRDHVAREAMKLIEDVLGSNGHAALLATLLTTDVGYVSSPSHKVYGVGDPLSYEPQRRTLPASERAGILTQPAFLASFSDTFTNLTVRRGRFINETLLCRHVPEVPIGVIPQLPPPGPGTTMRDRLAQHSKDPSCAVCHDLMDPLGLAFEMFEHWGKARTSEEGKPVNARGVLTGAGDADGPFENAVELTKRLARSPVVERCFVRHSFRYWMGRDEEAHDACALEAAEEAYASTRGDYGAVVGALVTSASFLYRSTP